MTNVTSPQGSIIDVARRLAPLVREHAAQGERERRLPDAVARAFNDAGIFRLCRPRELGGLEADPLTVIEVVEELSRADGAAGWCAMICGAGSVFDACIPVEGGKEMYESPAAVTAGVTAPTGRAAEVSGGYRVSGRWAMASNSHHCDWLGGMAVVFDGEAPRMAPNGMPTCIIAMVKSSDCRILDTWNTSGLAGTGSHDFEVGEVFVPHRRVIRVPAGEVHYPGALFAFPFFGMLATSVASVALGIGRASIDELVRVARTKRPYGMMSPLATRPSTHLAVAEAEALLSSGRAYLVETVREIWALSQEKAPVSLEQRAKLRLAATTATANAARAVDLMYTAGGASALYSHNPLQRHLRDVHAVTQHVAVAPPTRELQGQLLLGLEADASML